MPEFGGRYRFRKLDTPKDNPALNFSCGIGKYEDEVNILLIEQRTGFAQVKPVVFVMEDVVNEPAQTIGVSAWRLRTSPVSRQPDVLNEVYVHMIGLNEHYRGMWVPDGRSLGRVLLGATLKQIGADWSDNRMPAVWALVSKGNAKSQRMFGDLLFAKHTLPPPNDNVLWRPPGLRV
jgi:hypothetical protein